MSSRRNIRNMTGRRTVIPEDRGMLHMTLYFEKETKEELELDFETIARDVVGAALAFYHCPYEVCVSVYLVDDETIQSANLETRGIDKITDVLSFPNIPFEKEADFTILDDENNHYAYFDPDTEELILGEIMICQKRMVEQAGQYGHSILREYAFLLTHSMLHLLGYDHMEEAQRLRMEEAQRLILEQLSITRE